MAKGTITGTTGNEYIDSKIEWSSTTNIANNTSTVTAALYYRRNNTGYTTYGTGKFGIRINGVWFYEEKTLNIGTSWVKAVENTQTVTHLSDGTQSINISASGSISGTTLTSTSCSGTAKLDTIPRETEITSVVCTTKYFNGGIAFNYKSKSSAYYNKVNISLNLNGEFISVKNINLGKASAGVDYEEGFKFTDSELTTIYSRLTSPLYKGTLRLTLRTYYTSGYEEEIGDGNYKEITLSMPQDSTTKPTISAVIIPVDDITNPNFESVYVQGRSKLQATVTASGKYGAAIKSYNLSVEGNGSYTVFDKATTKVLSSDYLKSKYLPTVGDKKVTCTVTDSRGLTNTVTKTITVQAYSKPKIVPHTSESRIICARCDSEGNLNDQGTYLKIKVKKSYSKIKDADGNELNFCRVVYRYKASSATGFSNYNILLTPDDTEIETEPLLDGALLPTQSYVVEIGVCDEVEFNDIWYTFDIPTDKVYLHKAGSMNSLGIGKYAEVENAVDIADDIKVIIGGNEAEAVASTTEGDKTGSIKYASGLTIQWGSVLITPSAENTPTSAEVTFPIPYKSMPFVIVNPATSVPGTTVLGTSASSVSKTSFEAVLTRGNLTQTDIRWMAIGFSE